MYRNWKNDKRKNKRSVTLNNIKVLERQLVNGANGMYTLTHKKFKYVISQIHMYRNNINKDHQLNR